MLRTKSAAMNRTAGKVRSSSVPAAIAYDFAFISTLYTKVKTTRKTGRLNNQDYVKRDNTKRAVLHWPDVRRVTIEAG